MNHKDLKNKLDGLVVDFGAENRIAVFVDILSNYFDLVRAELCLVDFVAALETD